jgi:cytochrome c-type biogenesis protein CcmE
MKHKAIKIGLTSLVLLLSFGGLLWSTLSEETQYYKHVDEVMVAPARWEGKRLQMHGFAKSVMQKRGTLEYAFQVENNGHTVWAQYTGIAPDTFKNDSEVVLEGQLKGEIFHADRIIAKCPSKYEPKAGAASTTGTY